MIKRNKRTRMVQVYTFTSVRRREILIVQTKMISMMVVTKVSIFTKIGLKKFSNNIISLNKNIFIFCYTISIFK